MYFILVLFTVTAAATKGRGNVAVSIREAHSGHVILVAFIDVLLLVSASASLFLLSSSPFPPLSLFLPPSPLPQALDSS
jgi:hypothetical protein